MTGCAGRADCVMLGSKRCSLDLLNTRGENRTRLGSKGTTTRGMVEDIRRTARA